VTARDIVISLRVSAEEHRRLRAIAGARGLSVSDLIRSYVERETAPPIVTRTLAAAADIVVDGIPANRTAFFWQAPASAVTEGRTITLSAT
jgi:hypothetical protein